MAATLQAIGPHQVERAEAASIVEGDAAAFVSVDDEMVVLPDLVRVHPPLPRHAEMEHKRIAAIGADQAIFGAASKPSDPRTRQPLPEIHRKRPPEVRAPSFDPSDPPSNEDPLEPANGRLDFGKLGHRRDMAKGTQPR